MNNYQTNTDLHNYLQSLLKDQYTKFINADAEPQAIRVNTLKIKNEDFDNVLKQFKIDYTKIPFLKNGYLIKNTPVKLSHTLFFFRGYIYFQGVSSQIPVELLNIKPGHKILDIAASPGSKSTQIAAKMNNQGELVLNDYAYHRMQALNTNLQRSGALNFYVLNNFGERLGNYFTAEFDRILVDAPCTALGTYATNRDIEKWWSRDKLEKLANIQYFLMVSAIKALKPGGEIVYSTCSIAPEENEQVLSRIIKEYPLKISEANQDILEYIDQNKYLKYDSFNKIRLKNTIRVFPDVHGYEGFFAARLVKYDETKTKNNPKNLDYEKLRSAEDNTIYPILREISDQWGIDYNVWQNYHYKLTSKRIWIVAKSITKIPLLEFKFCGMLLADRKLHMWKLSHASVEYFANHINKRRLIVNDNQICSLFKNGKLSVPDIQNGYYALEHREMLFAVVYAENQVISIRLPHLFELILI